MYNNGTLIEFQPAASFISDYHSKMYGEEEQLLDVSFFSVAKRNSDLRTTRDTTRQLTTRCSRTSYSPTCAPLD